MSNLLYFFTIYHNFVGPWFKRTLNLIVYNEVDADDMPDFVVSSGFSR